MLGGTTVANMCKFLQNKRLTVITNSLLVFNMLKNNLLIKMILLGGEYSKEEDELKGSLTNSMMLRLGADYLFTSCSAFNERRGFLTNHIDSIELYNSCYEATKNVVMLSDSSKYMKNAIAVIAECSRVNCLISDKRLPQEAVMKFQEQSIRVITV